MIQDRQIIIGIAGRKGAGKDTAARKLVSHYGFTVVKFATPLKQMTEAYLRSCGVGLETIDRLVNGDLKEVPNAHFQGLTSRYFQQKLGTEFGRELIGDRIWIDAFKAACYGHPRIVNTDLRFPNELDCISLEMNGTTLKVADPNFVKPEHDHPSEAFIDDMHCDIVMWNDKTKRTADEFSDDVIELLLKLKVVNNDY